MEIVLVIVEMKLVAKGKYEHKLSNSEMRISTKGYKEVLYLRYEGKYI